MGLTVTIPANSLSHATSPCHGIRITGEERFNYTQLLCFLGARQNCTGVLKHHPAGSDPLSKQIKFDRVDIRDPPTARSFSMRSFLYQEKLPTLLKASLRASIFKTALPMTEHTLIMATGQKESNPTCGGTTIL